MAPQVVENPPTDVINPSQLLAVLSAFKRGDLTARMPIEQTGLAGKIADTLNDVIEMNERLAEELASLNVSVGIRGNTAHRASLPSAAGGWAASIDSVNALVTNMALPTNELGRVIGAVARGDLGQRVTVEVSGRPLEGDFLQTAKVVNSMVDQLASFSSEVTRVAREVGTEGKLGGQADVPNVAGIWKDLTDNVNQMASNLTGQVRNIADVTVAVANGDLSRKITVDVRGEFLQLKDTINTMVE